MIEILNISGILLLVLYLAFVISILIGLLKLKSGNFLNEYYISVVVAARNEEKNIGSCIESLIAQDYPTEKYEIIIVNDRSEDSTTEIIQSYIGKKGNLRKIDVQEVEEGVSPKKNALQKGIDGSTGEIILLTDADCAPPSKWIREMVKYFENDVGLVAGFSPLKVRGNKTGIFIDFLYTDALALAVSSAGWMGIGRGLTCAGRNLAYRKKLFDEVGGFEKIKHYISGDDDLLMHLASKETDWKFRYALGEDVIVPTFVDTGFGMYVNQRTRHASKYKFYPAGVKAAAAIVFLFYFSIVSFPVYMAVSWDFLWAYPWIFGGKAVTEFLTMKTGAAKLGVKFRLKSFLTALFIHPFFIVLFSILGVRGKFRWKGMDFRQ